MASRRAALSHITAATVRDKCSNLADSKSCSSGKNLGCSSRQHREAVLGHNGKQTDPLMPFHLQGDRWIALVAACQLCLSSGHLQLEPCQLLLQSSPLLLPGRLCCNVVLVQPCHKVPPVSQLGLLGKALLLQVPA